MGSPKLLGALLLHSPQDVRNLSITRRLCGIYMFKERNNKYARYARFEVHAVMLLRNHVFWDLILRCCIDGSQNFGGIMVLCNIMNQKAQQSQCATDINLLKPTGHVMHRQFNIQQLYALPTLYLCVLYLSENKQRLVPLTA